MGAWHSKGKATPERSSPWSALTPELLHQVLRRISSDADRLRFAGVCRHWRHVANQFRSGWSALPPAIADLVVRRLAAPADRARFASVCRHWRRVVGKFSSPWSSGLPPELACLVLRRLMYSHADRVRFAAVCRHWRYVATVYSPPLPPALPWICSSYGSCHSLPDGEWHHFFRSRKGELSYGPFGNWLLFEQLGGDRRSLQNPLNEATLRLPTHAKEPVYMYTDGSLESTSNKKSTYFDIDKVIVSAGELIIALVRYEYNLSNEVLCCRPGMSSWSLGLRNGYRCYQDMAVHMGKLYAVVNGGDLFAHDITEDCDTRGPKVSQIKSVIRAPSHLDGFLNTRDSATYLVNSLTGKLLLVRWFVQHQYNVEDRTKHLKLKVFEADFERSMWVEVERLEDQVLFVSSNCSMVMSASADDDYLQANKIYIVNGNVLYWYFWPKINSCTWGYDMCSKAVHPVSLGGRMIVQSDAAWFFSLT